MYRQGVVEIQDLASQQIAAAIAVRSGEKVWDCCAGAGGKSLAIAARMNNKGVLLATDLHGYKLDELKRRAKRAQLGNVRTFTWAGDEPLRLPKEIAQQKGFDWVLVDAPCSSSGTWRRNPDARWRFAPTDTAELVVLQQKILHNSAVAVRVGGHLVYATCSWQVSENEAQIALFLQNNPVFSLISQTILGAPQIDADTMFVAVLKRS
jgi:16S rRNA (cytosine967-C5)-methyltransferase